MLSFVFYLEGSFWRSRFVKNLEVDGNHIFTDAVLGQDSVRSLIRPLAASDDQLRVVGNVGDDQRLVPCRLDDLGLLLPGDVGRRFSDDVSLELQHLARGHGDVLQVLAFDLGRH